MTLQNGLVDGRKAYLWADTAYWDASTGEIVSHESKAFFGRSWPWAGIVSMQGALPRPVMDYIETMDPDDLETLLAVVSEWMRGTADMGADGRVLLATYDDRPRLHVIASHEVFPGSGYGPFEPVELDYFVCSCNDSAPAMIAAKRGYNLTRMRRVIDAQCSTPWEGHGLLTALGPRVWVGGEVMRVAVGTDGVASAVERAVYRGSRASG